MDADGFSRLTREGRYEEALQMWRGAPYEAFTDVQWLRPEIERLAETHLVAREEHLARLLERGDPHVAGELTTLVREHPLREGLWELLARALYRLGRQADALEALRAARVRLADELGLDPGPGLQRLESAILAQDPALETSRASARLAPAVPAVPGTPAAVTVVGRNSQLERLDELARETARGRPGIAVISGEPGIGKTWLAEAFADRRAAEGWRVAWGRCHETSGAPALWPWQQVVRRLSAEVAPGAAHAAPLEMLSTDGAGPVPPVEASEARFRLHRAAADYLDTVAADRPLLVVIDDLQWADSASLGLLTDLAALLRGGVAVVVTVRSGEGPAAMYDTLGMLSRRDALRLPLAGLDRAAVAELSGLGDEGTVDALARRTRGNPLFIREILRLAEDSGIGRALTAVPEGLADVLRRRLLRLPAAHRAVVDAAAVVGGAADALLLTEIVAARTGPAAETGHGETGRGKPGHGEAPGSGGGTAGQVREALDAAAGLRLLSDDLGFSHDLIRETVYADVPSRRRAELHLAALRVLERRPGRDPVVLARHALAAGPEASAEAVRWASATAAQAAGRHAHEDAARWWRRAVETHGHMPGADPARHVELLLELVGAQLNAGDGSGARETRAEAVLAAGGADDVSLTAKALTSLDAPGLWKFYTYGDVEPETVHRIEETLAALPPGDSVLRCRLLACLGMERYDGSADPRCDSATAEALAMARRLVARGEAGPRLLAFALNARYLGVHQPDRLTELEAVGLELTRLGLPGFELLGHLILERTRLEFFDVAGADRSAERARVLIDRLNLPWPRFQHLVWTAARRLADGDLDGADAAYAAAADAGERLNLWYTGSVLDSGMLARGILAGDLSDVEETVGRISPFPAHRQPLRALVAHFSGDAGALRAVREEGWPEPPWDFLGLSSLCTMGLAQHLTGDLEAGARTYRRLLPYEDRFACGAGTFPLGPVGYFLGLLAPDPATAGAHFAAAVKRCERAGLGWWARRIAAEQAARRS